jgi:hypothetical protein
LAVPSAWWAALRWKLDQVFDERRFLTLDDAQETIESWRIDQNQVRPYSILGYLTSQECATGYANVGCKHRFSHSHSLDGDCGQNPQLSSNPSNLTFTD